MRRVQIVFVAGLSAVAACSRGAVPRPTPHRDVLTSSEMAAANVVDAYEAVQRLRPRFLTVRGALRIAARGGSAPTSAAGAQEADLPTVYIDNRPLGPVDRLRELQVSTLHEIRFIDPTAATLRFGAGLPRGVILVVTRVSVGGQVIKPQR